MLTKSYYGKRKETPKMRKKDTQKCSFFAYDFSDKKGHIFCEQTKCVCENVCFMIPTKYWKYSNKTNHKFRYLINLPKVLNNYFEQFLGY